MYRKCNLEKGCGNNNQKFNKMSTKKRHKLRIRSTEIEKAWSRRLTRFPLKIRHKWTKKCRWKWKNRRRIWGRRFATRSIRRLTVSCKSSWVTTSKKCRLKCKIWWKQRKIRLRSQNLGRLRLKTKWFTLRSTGDKTAWAIWKVTHKMMCRRWRRCVGLRRSPKWTLIWPLMVDRCWEV